MFVELEKYAARGIVNKVHKGNILKEGKQERIITKEYSTRRHFKEQYQAGPALGGARGAVSKGIKLRGALLWTRIVA